MYYGLLTPMDYLCGVLRRKGAKRTDDLHPSKFFDIVANFVYLLTPIVPRGTYFFHFSSLLTMKRYGRSKGRRTRGRNPNFFTVPRGGIRL